MGIWKKVTLFCILLLVAQACFANAGVPMIVLIMPAFGFVIIPIILIESFIFKKKCDVNWKTTFKSVTISNIVSTIVGIPVTWCGLVLVQMLLGGGGAKGLATIPTVLYAVTVQAAWLIPYEGYLHWMVPSATAFLMIPFFAISWWSEYFVYRKIHKDICFKQLKYIALWTNLTTYLLLELASIAWLVYALNTGTNGF